MGPGREDAELMGEEAMASPAGFPNESAGNKVTRQGKKPAKIKWRGKWQTGENTFHIPAARGSKSLLYKEFLQINKDDEHPVGKGHGQAIY